MKSSHVNYYIGILLSYITELKSSHVNEPLIFIVVTMRFSAFFCHATSVNTRCQKSGRKCDDKTTKSTGISFYVDSINFLDEMSAPVLALGVFLVSPINSRSGVFLGFCAAAEASEQLFSSARLFIVELSNLIHYRTGQVCNYWTFKRFINGILDLLFDDYYERIRISLIHKFRDLNISDLCL